MYHFVAWIKFSTQEVAHFLEYIRTGDFSPLKISEKYGPLLSYLSPSFRLEPDLNIRFSAEACFYEHMAGIAQNMSLTQLISRFGNKSFPNIDTARNYQAANQSRRELSDSSTRKARRIEIEHIARSIVIPKLNNQSSKFPVEEQIKITQRITELPRNKKYNSAIEHIIKFMPALSAYAEMLTVSGLDSNRKDHPSDFFDRELLVYALSYSTVFATVDGWIKSLVNLCRQSRFPGIFKFAGSLDDLDSYLDMVVNEI